MPKAREQLSRRGRRARGGRPSHSDNQAGVTASSHGVEKTDSPAGHREHGEDDQASRASRVAQSAAVNDSLTGETDTRQSEVTASGPSQYNLRSTRPPNASNTTAMSVSATSGPTVAERSARTRTWQMITYGKKKRRRTLSSFYLNVESPMGQAGDLTQESPQGPLPEAVVLRRLLDERRATRVSESPESTSDEGDSA